LALLGWSVSQTQTYRSQWLPCACSPSPQLRGNLQKLVYTTVAFFVPSVFFVVRNAFSFIPFIPSIPVLKKQF
jgi:hypothetical protein